MRSVGSRGDGDDNVLAESFNGLYKTELIRQAGPWRGLDDVEYATREYVDWFNHRRLHGEVGTITPAESSAWHSRLTWLFEIGRGDRHPGRDLGAAVNRRSGR